MTQYVLGVDGGNSKTDYYLFSSDGAMVDGLRAGTCSHEQFPDGFDAAKRELALSVNALLSRNHLAIEDVSAAAFGLAGADYPDQKANLERVIRELGFARFVVDNDGFLGIKAGCPDGYGVCCINGSGTVTVGIGADGARLQVGGVGSDLSGDEAGGFYLSRRVIRAVYDSFYRMGPKTALAEPLFDLLNVSEPSTLLQTACALMGRRAFPTTDVLLMLFATARSGDAAAQQILCNCAQATANSVLGCLSQLHFPHGADIVLAGSVWVKTQGSLLHTHFHDLVTAGSPVPCHIHTLNEPPATGAVLWALELLHTKPITGERADRVFHQVNQFLRA